MRTHVARTRLGTMEQIAQETRDHAASLTAEGLELRNVSPNTIVSYLGLVSTCIDIVAGLTAGREVLSTDAMGQPQYFGGRAAKIRRFTAPLSPEIIKLLFAELSTKASSCRRRRGINALDSDDEEEVDPTNPSYNRHTVSAQTYQNYKSALRWFTEYGDPAMGKEAWIWTLEGDLVARKAISAYKRDVGGKQRRGIMTKGQGMDSYNYAGYLMIIAWFDGLAPIGRKYSWTQGIFGALFTTMSVHTIGRSDNIDDLGLVNINWLEDAMTICFDTTKSDQAGERTSDVKRLYANPFTPEACVIFHLAVFIWCKHRTSEADCRLLFDGTDQKSRYYCDLKTCVKEVSTDGVDLGMAALNIGTHSNRKFAESTAVSRPDGPTHTMVCLRAGQSVGKAQDSYMKQEPDGDAFVGRTTAQLQLTAEEFDVLPQRFNTVTLAYLAAYGWKNILPGFENYPESFGRAVVPKLLAQLVYHWHNGNLTRLFNKDHPIFKQRLFTEPTLLNHLKDTVLVGHAYCEDTKMTATGVPGMIQIAREIRDLRQRFDHTDSANKNRIDDLQRTLTTLLEDLPDTIVSKVMARVRVEGAKEVTIEDIKSIINSMMNDPDGALSSISRQLDQQTVVLSQLQQTSSTSAPQNHNSQQQLSFQSGAHSTIFLWPNSSKMHVVPFGFKWGSYSCYNMWELWWFGDASKNIGPYRHIKPAFDLTTQLCLTNRSRTATIVEKLVAAAISGSKIRTAADITRQNSSVVFSYAYTRMMSCLYKEKACNRPDDMMMVSVYNKYQRTPANKRNFDQVEEEDGRVG